MDSNDWNIKAQQLRVREGQRKRGKDFTHCSFQDSFKKKVTYGAESKWRNSQGQEAHDKAREGVGDELR